MRELIGQHPEVERGEGFGFNPDSDSVDPEGSVRFYKKLGSSML